MPPFAHPGFLNFKQTPYALEYVQPEIAGDIETLTQRYWECMFSRMVMVGHAPQELIDFIGYNPVIELSDKISSEELIADVIEYIEDYQFLVDKNRETAERLGSWDVRMKWLMVELSDLLSSVLMLNSEIPLANSKKSRSFAIEERNM